MARLITPRQWAIYEQRRARGWSVAHSAREAKIGLSSAHRREMEQKGLTPLERKWLDPRLRHDHPMLYNALKPEAKRALVDFGYFQRRYFGRIATPWQVTAAEQVVEMLAEPAKAYVVINAPPGSGKSTLFAHDIPAWLTVRNRRIRGLIGSKSATSAMKYVQRLKRSFETMVPVQAEDSSEVDLGLATDAEATLGEDFGSFRPANKDQWSGEAFVVAQLEGRLTTQKEPTWTAYGRNSGFLGMRYDFIVWDDLIDPSMARSAEGKEDLEHWWDSMAEKRLDPGGLLVLQGQRLGSDDIYRYALDKRRFSDSDDDLADSDADLPRKYHHIVFKAHYLDRCTENHGQNSPYYPDNCLLDPRRLTWSELASEMVNNSAFEVIYQQEDVDPAECLIDRLWVKGGVDPLTGELYPGCLEPERGIAELPQGLAGGLLSIATADPSPSKNWSIQWWVVRHVDGMAHERYLMDHIRQRMDAPGFLDWHENTRTFTGVMEDWQARSDALGLPIRYWIVEINSAQKFLLQYDHVRRWTGAWRNTSIIPHETQSNKSDPNYGIEVLKSVYRYGLVRLPYRPGPAYVASVKLIDEVTHWPTLRTDDCVMAQWFLEWHLPKLLPVARPLPRANRPSWLKEANTWGHRRAQKRRELVHGH